MGLAFVHGHEAPSQLGVSEPGLAGVCRASFEYEAGLPNKGLRFEGYLGLILAWGYLKWTSSGSREKFFEGATGLVFRACHRA